MRTMISAAATVLLLLAAGGCQPRGSANPLDLTEHEVLVTDENFNELVKKASKPVLLDFSASWCPPCRTMAPIVQRIAEENSGRLVVGVVDVDRDDSAALSQAFRVANIPAFYIVVDGDPVATIGGAIPEEAFRSWVNKYAFEGTEVLGAN